MEPAGRQARRRAAKAIHEASLLAGVAGSSGCCPCAAACVHRFALALRRILRARGHDHLVPNLA